MNDSLALCPPCLTVFKSKAAATPGAGYRLLEIGETIRATDETFFRGHWTWQFNDDGQTFDGELFFFPRRRKVEVEPSNGYRLLKTGEIIQTGDEIWENGNTWFPRTSLSIGLAQGQTGVSFPTRRKIDPPAIDPGVGYRLLKVGEAIEAGDEIYDGGWRVTFIKSGKVKDATFRRKIIIDPGEGYRLLKVGEVRQRGDEYRSKFPPSWVTTEDEGEPISSECSLTYRRKIAVEAVIDPGVGYRLLVPNEALAVGDEIYNSYLDVWERFYDYTAGQPLCPGLTARRSAVPAIDPGVGYRLLAPDEVFQSGDEHFNSETGKWWACYCCRPGNVIYVAPGDFSCAATRRKVDWGFSFTSPVKKYRLLAVGEIIRETDEMWYGLWVPCTGLIGVKTAREGNSPIRREISDYVGGPA